MNTSLNSIPGDAADMRAAAAAWIRRRAAGMSAAERDEFQRWIAADVRHGRMLAKMNTAGDDCDWMWHARAVEEVAASLKKRSARRRRTRRVMVSMGAVAVLALATIRWRVQEPSPTTVASAAVESMVVVEPQRRELPDGSRVQLNAGAVIDVDFNETTRRVALHSGEAFFDVAKDAARPFVVAAGGLEVRAVGTEFAVQVNSASVEVLVAEGKVTVDHPTLPSLVNPGKTSPSKSIGFLERGNRLSVSVAAPVAAPVETVSESELAEKLAWRVPRLKFMTTPLRTVLERLEGYNRARAVLVDPVLGDLRISGVLRADRLDSLVEMLESDFDVQVERPNDQEILLRKKR